MHDEKFRHLDRHQLVTDRQKCRETDGHRCTALNMFNIVWYDDNNIIVTTICAFLSCCKVINSVAELEIL